MFCVKIFLSESYAVIFLNMRVDFLGMHVCGGHIDHLLSLLTSSVSILRGACASLDFLMIWSFCPYEL